jgi:hypothetical protein
MGGIQAFVLFCDSVRDETTSTQTIVGVLPDNLNIPKVPAAVPRLTLYVRIMLDPARDPGPMALWLIFPDGQERTLQTFEAGVVNEARTRAQESNMPYAGLLSNITFPNFPVLQYGRVKAVLRVGDEEILCGALTFREAPASSELGQLATLSLPVPKGLAPPDEPSRP